MDQIIDFDSIWSVGRFVVVTFIVIFVRYVLISVIFIGVFEIILKDKFAARKISDTLRQKNQTKREVHWSLITSFIFAVSGTLMLYFYLNGDTALYTDFTLYDFWYIPLSIFITLLLHETYYYFLHRWMHNPKVFKHFHNIHHESHVTSAWTAFSFHPYESIIQALVIPLIILFLPLHVFALFFLLLVMTISATINHLNIEIYPKWMATTGIGKWIIGATHHSHHHKYYNKNFGLYFTFFDRWLKTESDDFEELFAEKTKEKI